MASRHQADMARRMRAMMANHHGQEQPDPTLAGLPAELRLLVYKHLLNHVFLREYWNPADEVPSHARFEIYRALVLTCRLFRNEIEPLFQQEYAHRTVFYFEEVLPLYQLVRFHHGNFPAFDTASFHFSYTDLKPLSQYRSCNFIRDYFRPKEVEMLVFTQPFFDPSWVDRDVLCFHLTDRQTREGWVNEWPQLHITCKHEESCEDDYVGFSFTSIDSDCDSADERTDEEKDERSNTGCEHLLNPVYNPQQTGLLRRLASYWWPKQNTIKGRMVMTGRFRDIDFSDFESRHDAASLRGLSWARSSLTPSETSSSSASTSASASASESDSSSSELGTE